MSIRFERSPYSGEIGVIDRAELGISEAASECREWMSIPGAFRMIGDDRPLTTTSVKSLSGSYSGKMLCGLAAPYGQFGPVKTKKGPRIHLFATKCFDQSLARGDNVALLFDHDGEQKIADTSSGLELFSDEAGLWFKFWPSRDANSRLALERVANGAWAAVSVGALTVKARTSRIAVHGIPVKVVHEAHLTEISFIETGQAAMKSTAAILADGAEFKDFQHEISVGMLAGIRSQIKTTFF